MSGCSLSCLGLHGSSTAVEPEQLFPCATTRLWFCCSMSTPDSGVLQNKAPCCMCFAVRLQTRLTAFLGQTIDVSLMYQFFALFYISGGSCQTWEDQINVKQRPTMLKCHLVWSCICWAPYNLKPFIIFQSTIQLCKWQRWPENCKLRAARCLLFKGAHTSKRNLGNFPHCLRLVSRLEQA